MLASCERLFSRENCTALAGGAGMLTRAIETYLAVRRAAGFALRNTSYHLRSFAAFSEARKQHYISTEIAIAWAGLAPSLAERARRLGTIIRFARYLRAEDDRHEVPPAIFGRVGSTRPTPYILTPEQVRQLIESVSQSGYKTLRRATYRTLFSLLACTGLRVSEAIRLRLDDITPDGLVIRCTKFRKSRLVPLHETARAGLQRYLELRRPYAPFDDHVFISLRRKPLLIENVERAFRTAAISIGLPCTHGVPHPTPHSLRHAFAVSALKTCPDDR